MRSGFTLVEVLIGLVVLAVLGGALSALQVGTLRANRNAQIRLQAAALLSDELALQRVLVGPGSGEEGNGTVGTTAASTHACALWHMPDEWQCSVRDRCLSLAGLAPCAARVFTVELVPPSGQPLLAGGASFRWTGATP